MHQTELPKVDSAVVQVQHAESIAKEKCFG